MRHSNSIFLSGNCPSKVYHSGPVFDSSLQLNVLSTSRTHRSWLLRLLKLKSLHWNVFNTALSNLILSSSSKTSRNLPCISIQSKVHRWTMSKTGLSTFLSFFLVHKVVDHIGLVSSVDIPMSEGPVNLNWGPIMKHINENPYEFFQGGGWSFLGGVGGAESEESEQSDSTSEFEAESDDFAESSSEDESEYSAEDNASEESGSYDDDDSDEGAFDFYLYNSPDTQGALLLGDDWDELERKAAKADAKRAEERKKGNRSDDSDDDRPKKKKAAPAKANGKANGKSKR